MSALAQPRKMKFSPTAIAKLKPEQDDFIAWDITTPGFGVRVHPGGKKVWVAAFNIRWRQRKPQAAMITLGALDTFTDINEMRSRAQKARAIAHDGKDPRAAQKQEARAAAIEAAAAALTFPALVDKYLVEYAEPNTRTSTYAETRRLLARAAPLFDETPVRDIKRLYIRDVMVQLRAQKIRPNYDGLVEANHLLGKIKAVFRWALGQGLIETDPSAGIPKPMPEVPERKRVLNDEEIIALWLACEKLGYPWGDAVRLMLLTGQRVNEVAGMRWSELDLKSRVWTLPPAESRQTARTKNGEGHEVWLNDAAMRIINGLHGRRVHAPPDKDFVFTITGRKPISSFEGPRTNLDAIMAESIGPVPYWQLRDLRRTQTTHLSRFKAPNKVPLHIADMMLNHCPAALRGTAGRYNRAEYWDEQVAAWEVWGRFIEGLLDPTKADADVVVFRLRA